MKILCLFSILIGFTLYPEPVYADIITPILAFLGSVGASAGVGTGAVAATATAAATTATAGAIAAGTAIVGGTFVGARKILTSLGGGRQAGATPTADAAAEKARKEAEQKSLMETREEEKKGASRRALLSTPTSGFGPNTNLARSFLTSL